MPPTQEGQPAPPTPGDGRADIAVISNEPTPYRLHVLGRIARELPQARLHSIFTHSVEKPSMPWRVELRGDINPVVFPNRHLRRLRFFSVTSLPLYRALTRYIREKNIRLVILLGYGDLTRLLLVRWAHREGVPLLLTGDSNALCDWRTSGPAWLIKRAQVRWVLRRVAGLMPMGTAGRAFFRVYANHDLPTFLFPYEPDYDALARRSPQAERAFREEHGLAEGRRRLLYSGRLVGQKRVDVLLDAFAQIAGERPDWDVAIAGSGPLEASLKQRVPPHLRERVKWLGFLQFGDVATCYRCCDALVLPSEYEPWALVVNEAVASGLAVIATEIVGAAVELVKHRVNGLIVAPRSVSAMAEALRELGAPGACDAMRGNAARILADWRTAADPVEGVRQAMRHFKLIKP